MGHTIKIGQEQEQFIGKETRMPNTYKEMLDLIKENQIKLYGCIIVYISNWQRSENKTTSEV